jgi:hypothetical protein
MYMKPCTDKPQSKEDVKLENIEKTTNHQDAGFDGCSPFCSCACCSISVVSNNFQKISFIPQKIEASYLLNLPSKVLKISIAFWQPPKFV